jgi:hypothetical protein
MIFWGFPKSLVIITYGMRRGKLGGLEKMRIYKI